MARLTKEEYFAQYGGREVMEFGKMQMREFDFPNPKKRYRLEYESYNASIEEVYFWYINYLVSDLGISRVDKITDIFTASEHSAFFGVAQQRVGLQQDKVIQFLATIGKMIKDLFQLVRELRILDERLGYYRLSESSEKRIAEPAEITLKGLYIDMAEGGAKSPASVYGMARELQFTTLPDLFFGTHPKSAEEVGAVVDALDFNKSVRAVLKRKLVSYLRWKEETKKELQSRRVFTLRYLKQHFDIIKMYIAWVKPYLRNIRRLQSEDRSDSPELISAFEGSLVEIEILAVYKPQKNKEYYSCISMLFEYRTRPSMNYQQEGYQRGPIHVGRVKITTRGYAWNEKDIVNYKQMRRSEELEMLTSIDASLQTAMEALGDDLQRYLDEAEKANLKKEPAMPKFENPLVSALKGFGELFGSLAPAKEKKKGMSKLEIENEKEAAAGTDMRNFMWLLYKNFKKGHRMLTW